MANVKIIRICLSQHCQKYHFKRTQFLLEAETITEISDFFGLFKQSAIALEEMAQRGNEVSFIHKPNTGLSKSPIADSQTRCPRAS